MAKSNTNKPAKTIFTPTEENRKKLNVVAALEDRDKQDIINEALADWLARYEKKHGPVPVKGQ